MRTYSGNKIIGGRFGELTVIGIVGEKTYPSGQKARLLKSICSCGQETIDPDRQLTSGRKQSCGHLKRSPRIKTHGYARGKSGRGEWRTWRAMKNRCSNPKDNFYHIYGGRGIKICESWEESFENFIRDMGDKPTPKHELDRINHNGDYEPGNCRWATRKEQANNTRQNVFIEYKGEIHTIAQWSEILGINYATLHHRLRKRKLPIDEAFNR